MSRGRVARVVLAVALATAAAACSRDDGVAAPPLAAGLVRGGTLRVAIAEPSSVDPATVDDDAGRLVVATMCDPLLAFDPVSGQPRPALAESWQLSDRGRKIVVRLRRGARFSDGRAVTADDVLFSLSRLASAELASPTSGAVGLIKGYPAVHGDEDTDDEDVRRSLKGIKVIEGNSLEIELVGELAPFVRVLGHPATTIVSRAAVEADPVAFERRPVCSGPYRLAAPWSRGSGPIVLERSPGYKARNAALTGGGVGYADRIELVPFPTHDAALAAYRQGSVDVADVAPGQLADVRATLGTDLVRAATPTVEYVGVPLADETFRSPAVRRALSAALDRTAIAETTLRGARLPATGFLPATLGPALSRPQPCPAIAPTADVPLARQLLSDAHVDLTGRSLTFSFNDELANRPLVEAVAAQWRAALGLQVELRPVPWQEYLSTGVSGDGFRGAFRVSWTSVHPDPDAYVAPLFTADGVGQANFGRFSNPDLDRRLRTAARRALDEDGRVLEYRRLEDMLCELMPLVPVTVAASHHLIRHGRIAAPDGRAVTLSTGLPNLRELSVRA